MAISLKAVGPLSHPAAARRSPRAGSEYRFHGLAADRIQCFLFGLAQSACTDSAHRVIDLVTGGASFRGPRTLPLNNSCFLVCVGRGHQRIGHRLRLEWRCDRAFPVRVRVKIAHGLVRVRDMFQHHIIQVCFHHDVYVLERASHCCPRRDFLPAACLVRRTPAMQTR